MALNRTTAATIVAVLIVIGVGYFFTHKHNFRPAEQQQGSITGIVLLGPTCPIERMPPDSACADKPFQTGLVAITPNGSTVAQTFSSDANGKFSVALPPGEYVIQASAHTNFYPRCMRSDTIRVTAGISTEITISCDTGIR